MLLRQLIDQHTYTYLLADPQSGEALLIDPVFEKTEQYVQLLTELQLTLKFALDTHIHADHITALGALSDRLGCVTLTSANSGLACADRHVVDGEFIHCGTLALQVLATPGHTDDSMCFYLSQAPGYLFSGDTLLIRGTGRTDFQNGNSEKLYDSLFNKLLRLSDETIVYPGHDYKGWTQSTIGEEKANNPRLQVGDIREFVRIMNSLALAPPKMMDVAIPANLQCGKVLSNKPLDASLSARGAEASSITSVGQGLSEAKRHSARFTTSGQIQPSDLAMMAAQGFGLLINNRPDNESKHQPSSDDIAQAAQAAGINYIHIPIRRTLPQADVDKMALYIKNNQGASFAFCRTGTRSTNLWLMTLDQPQQDQAIEQAKALGYDLSLMEQALRGG